MGYNSDEVVYEEPLTDNISKDCKKFLMSKGYDLWGLMDILFDKGVTSPHGLKRKNDKIQGDFLDFFDINGMENKRFFVKDQYGYVDKFKCDINKLKDVLRKGFESLNKRGGFEVDRAYYIEYDNDKDN